MDDDGLKKSDRSIKSSSVRKTDKTVSVELTDGSARTSKITTTILIALLVVSITVGGAFVYLYFSNNTQKIIWGRGKSVL